MLVITRRDGERVRVEAGGVTFDILLLTALPGRVRLGFDAPKDKVKVVRTELLRKEKDDAKPD